MVELIRILYVVETSVTATDNSPSQDYTHPDDQTTPSLLNSMGVMCFDATCTHLPNLRYLKGQVFQDSSLIVHKDENCILQLVFKLDQSAEILSTVTLAPIQETSKQVTAMDDTVVKQGLPSHHDLEDLSTNIGSKWEQLGRRLGFSGEELDGIDRDKRLLSQKAYQMLKEWKERNGSEATYKILYAALSHRLIWREDLAEKYCVLSHDELEDLSANIGSKWEQLGCRLGFSREVLQEIHLDERLLFQKALQMLKEWKNRNGINATYQTLYAALSHRDVSRKDLAEKYFKQGLPSYDELDDLSENIGSKWEQLGRRLGFSGEELDRIDTDKRLLSQKAYQMLKEWKERNGSDATYKTLYAALSHRFISREDLAEKYFKQGLPSHDELEVLSADIGSEWKQLGYRLSFSHQELQKIDLNERHLSWKAYQMLKEWKIKNGSKATYQTLYAALSHRSISRKDLAVKFSPHSTEVEQVEESGSAAEIQRPYPIIEPGTSGVSSTSKKKKIMKEGILSANELQTLGKAIGNEWDRLACPLKI
ncbi:Receptor-interacting serine/threonine-protein kinase 1 [Stylophora pistillata]|uniref:Receptor-interacting serine/threonine-protein kinase 1 n=1 Tax=Stylophora pistillata TaxID=50429 RepID=A0A2B4RT26_STYPI|nr:Receptor-interacting serine/threonine-protein kinase 1 [Stylophora pistillata]